LQPSSIILEVDLHDDGIRDSCMKELKPAPAKPKVKSSSRLPKASKFSLPMAVERFNWPCGMTNFHCYLLVGIFFFFVFWLLLLLRIYLPGDYFDHNKGGGAAAVPTKAYNDDAQFVSNKTMSTDANSTSSDLL
jgi:hypothetical protein